MPELPEVETTARGIRPHVVGKRIADVIVRDPRLRWRVPASLAQHLRGNVIERVERRAKYLLLRAHDGTVLVHLGMSGSLRILPADTPHQKHDHVDIVFADHSCLRMRDPRRFGAMLWCDDDCSGHKLLRGLGPEPLADAFDGAHLFARSRGRKVGVKLLLMDARIVVGVGNIYANEALFLAGIRPRRPAGRVTRAEYDRLARAIKQVLNDAIQQGGTTLRDYVRSTGDLGYFQLKLNVYGKTGEPCPKCGQPIRQIKQGQRSTFYCARCQR
jgi:formamidopyrimidine-DNA glycosylase